ncbi:hypothetical protein LAZ67_2007040 [Cordylochernes scorpioides]|uniref:Transposase n=1 Tax=Cordylochernes scorpioides TaxID=51811 RepID=A0ABY6K7D2_9ARAC|nr:hypothetical protein LAZ67_2007040 [Cordylochernes scorpioides]
MEAGQSQAEVARWLGVTRNVSRLWKKFQTTANVARTPGQGRPKVTTLNQDRYLSLLVRRNRRMTASQLRSDLNAATGVLVSTDTIRRRLHKKGLYARRPIICVPLTPPQKRARKLWCRQHVAWNPDEWRRVMFTDESRLSLNSDSHRVFVWREVGTRNNPRNMVERDPYRSQGFMVWAGIFLGGRTALHIFRQGTLTGQRYRDEILAAYVMPQALEMGENFLLMDDNARPHRAGVVDTFLQNHAIARMNWPARSPDLNPIEHVWDNLGRQISSLQPPPRNTHELETALTQEWALIPQELINSLILSMGRRSRACLSNFLVIVKAENYNDIVNDPLLSYKALGCNMSLRIHFLHLHLDFFPDNLGAVRDEHGEMFHQDILSMVVPSNFVVTEEFLQCKPYSAPLLAVEGYRVKSGVFVTFSSKEFQINLVMNYKVDEATFRRVVHENLRYKSYVMWRGQFMSERTKVNRLTRAKCLLNKLKHPEEPGISDIQKSDAKKSLARVPIAPTSRDYGQWPRPLVSCDPRFHHPMVESPQTKFISRAISFGENNRNT